MSLAHTFSIASGANVPTTATNLKLPGNLNLDSAALFSEGAWTGADIKFQVARDIQSPVWVDVTQADGTLVEVTSIPTSGGFWTQIPAEALNILNSRGAAGMLFRVASIDTTDDTAENQGAARTIYLIGSEAPATVQGHPGRGENP